MLETSDLKDFLEAKVQQYNTPEFISTDPVSIPHRYTRKEDIEISGFLAATIAWGNRRIIVRNAHRMMNYLGDSPYDFVMEHRAHHLEPLEEFVHRTFNGEDFKTFIRSLKWMYTQYGGIQTFFTNHKTNTSLQPAISQFKAAFFEPDHPTRSEKHVSSPLKGSSAKRINMYLRWMVRQDASGVDLGIWEGISPGILSCPLDVHSGKVARKLGLLQRKQNDAKAVVELDQALRQLDPEDPVKYDFALFGLGIFEGF